MSNFMKLYGLEIQRAGDHFTFADLVDAPDFSIPGGTFLGCPTTELYEGRPWEVMRENAIVYNFTTGLVVPIASIIATAKIQAAGKFYAASGMLLPGSIMDDGSRVTDYAAFFTSEGLRYRYSEVTSE